jgi:2-polyprenyl-6-methoxyphenol hydroxylase-like FAD-dependent oxidoreductase
VIFKTDSLDFGDCKQYYYQFTPPDDAVGGVVCPIEDGKAIATIVEFGRPDKFKLDLNEYLNLANEIRGGTFARILKNAVPLSDVSVYYKPTMYIRNLHKVKDFPENVFAMGDAFCSLNPVFGQGMTLALEQALLLDRLLRTQALNQKRFHHRSAQKARLAFYLSKFGSGVNDGLARRYLHNYLSRCRSSDRRHRKFLGLVHLEGSFSDLVDFHSLGTTLMGGTLG